MFNTTTIPAIAGAIALDHLSAIAADLPASMLAEDITDRIALADLAEIDGIVHDMRLDHTGGRITVDELAALEEAAADRREVLTEPARAARERARELLDKPAQPARPVTPEARERVRQWWAFAMEKLEAGEINDGDLHCARVLMSMHTVKAGGFNMASDEQMGERQKAKEGTARKRRRRLTKAKLVEVRGRGKDGRPNVVRPIMPDGTPVFLDPEEATGVVQPGHRGWSKKTTDTFTDLRTDLPPPLAPSVPAEPVGEGRAALDRIEAEGTASAQARSDGPEAASELEPAKPIEVAQQALPQPHGADAPKSGADAPAGSAAMFPRLWAAMAMGRAERETGPRGVALAAFLGLSEAAKAKAWEIASRPGFRPPSMWVSTWLRGGAVIWEEAPAAAPAYVVIRRGTPQAAVLEKLRGPMRWTSEMRTVALDEQLRAALAS
jgi:hypothetical protein